MTDAVMLTENALRSVASDIEIYYKKKAPNGSWCIATCQNAAEQFASMREKLERLQSENSTLKKALELACESIAGEMPYGEANGYSEYYIKKAKEESENG